MREKSRKGLQKNRRKVIKDVLACGCAIFSNVTSDAASLLQQDNVNLLQRLEIRFLISLVSQCESEV